MSETRFDPVAHARSMRDQGFWVDKNFDEFLQQTIAATPGKLALLADRADRPEAKRFTYAELGDMSAEQLSNVMTKAASTVQFSNPQMFVDMMTLAKILSSTTGKVRSAS